jgi:hypothetical protein
VTTLFSDELDRVTGGNPVQYRPKPTEVRPGGEWDYLRALPKRTRRRLIGAGYLSPRGERPDVVAGWIIDRVPGIETTDEAIAW